MKSVTVTRRRRNLWAVFLSIVGLMAFLVVPGLYSPPAYAVVSAGEIVYQQDTTNPGIYQQHGATSTLLLGDPYAQSPDVSPDGSRIAYKNSASGSEPGIYVMNSDGSGATEIAGRVSSEDTLGSTPYGYSLDYPRWSPDGQSIIFWKYSMATGTYRIKTVPAAGGAQTVVVSSTTFSLDYQATWSPAKDSNGVYRIAYVNNDAGFTQIHIVESNGNNDHIINGLTGSLNDSDPSWSPSGTKIYFATNEAYTAPGMGTGIKYFTYTGSGDPFSTTNVTRANTPVTTERNYSSDYHPRVSADGSMVYFETSGYGSASSDVAKVSASGGTVTRLTTATWNGAIHSPSPVAAAWPPAPPSNATATFNAPTSSDVPYTRQVTVGLSATGNHRFDLGWSTSSTAAPNTSYLQTITNMTTKKGPINFLGKYSGTGTTWNGGTQPDQDWYLWVRSVKTNGTANAWATPLKMHTPKRPVWVGVGDSYSSGHHQDSDEPWCPTAQEAPIYYAPGETACIIAGAPHLTPNDLNYSWVKKAVDSYNTTLHAPTDPLTGWSYGLDLTALSGAWTSSFGVSGTTPGTDAWASGTAQSYSIRADLYTRYNSWPVVSMTGGANDTNWVDKLTDFYSNPSRFIPASPAPWAVSTANPSVDCPDSQSVWNWLKATQLDGQTLDAHIQTNLQGIVTVATRYSPGARIINMGYPYMVNAANSCSSDSGSWHGSKSVIDDLNADHTAVTGANVHYISLTAATGFGPNPVAAGYLQLRRLYGYPHPVDTGQTAMANLTVSNLTGTW